MSSENGVSDDGGVSGGGEVHFVVYGGVVPAIASLTN